MYEKDFSSGPNWDEVSPVVAIMGSWHNDLLYPEPGQIIQTIWITHEVLNLDEPLLIPLELGEYKGGCERVSSVNITNYSAGTIKDTVTGEMNADGKIDILVSLTDGRSLRIHYRGKIPYDGYY